MNDEYLLIYLEHGNISEIVHRKFYEIAETSMYSKESEYCNTILFENKYDIDILCLYSGEYLQIDKGVTVYKL